MNCSLGFARGELSSSLEPAELVYRFRMTIEGGITLLVQAILVYYVRHKTPKVLDYLCEGSIVFHCTLVIIMNLATIPMDKQEKNLIWAQVFHLNLFYLTGILFL
jgi:hypothetical protein